MDQEKEQLLAGIRNCNFAELGDFKQKRWAILLCMQLCPDCKISKVLTDGEKVFIVGRLAELKSIMAPKTIQWTENQLGCTMREVIHSKEYVI